MRLQRILMVLTVLNLALLIFTLSQTSSAAAEGSPGMLRGRGLEIVDEQGRVRASITVLPAKTAPSDQAYPETVLLRLVTERGRPSVKISASEQASALSFAGPTGTKDTYVVLEAKHNATSLRMKNEDGREQIVQP
jgi:hypothetical protein